MGKNVMNLVQYTPNVSNAKAKKVFEVRPFIYKALSNWITYLNTLSILKEQHTKFIHSVYLNSPIHSSIIYL